MRSLVITSVVITLISEKLFPLADHREQCNQLSQLGFIKVAELFPVNLVNPVLDLVEQVQAAPGNPCHDVASVLAAPLPDDQLRLFETIEKTRDVRNLPHQSFGDFTSAKARGLRPAQNSKNVVLRRRDAVRF
jgi:hypothetical protein